MNRYKWLVKVLNLTNIPDYGEPTRDGTHYFVLYCLASLLKPEVCVELGSQRGFSAIWTAAALDDNCSQSAHIWCVDKFVGCGKDKKPLFLANVESSGLKDRITLIEKDLVDAVDDVPEEIDFLLIDAAHDYESCRRDADLYMPKLSIGGIVLFHDYKTCKGVKEAVDEIDKEDFFEIPIPTYNYGLYALIRMK